MADPNAALFQALQNIINGIGTQPTRSSNTFDVAKYLLADSSVDFSFKPTYHYSSPVIQKQDSGGWKSKGLNILGRAVDLLSRPAYGATESIKRSGIVGLSNPINWIPILLHPDKIDDRVKGYTTGMASGISGKSKTLPSTLARERGILPKADWKGIAPDDKGDWLNFIGGLGLDIFADPSTYFGGPLIRGAASGIKAAKASKAVKPVMSAEDILDDAKLGNPKIIEPVKKTDDVEIPDELLPLVINKADKRAKSFSKYLPSAQANLFRDFRKTIEYRGLFNNDPHAVNAASLNMLRKAEEHLSSKGTAAVYWDKTGVKLSEVIDELGGISKITNLDDVLKQFGNQRIKTSPEVYEAIQKVRAKSAVKDAHAVDVILEQSVRNADAADNTLSSAGSAQIQQAFKQDAKDVLKATGASPASQKAISPLLKSMQQARLNSSQRVFVTHAGTLQKVSNKVPNIHHAFNKVREAQTKALNEVLEEPITRAKAGTTVSNSAVINGIMSRVATWYGQSDLRPQVLTANASALASAEKRAAALRPLFKGTNSYQRELAMKVVQNRFPREMVDDPKVLALSDGLKKSMESLFKSTGLTEEAVKGNTAGLRSGMVIDDINESLKRYGSKLRFDADKTDDWLNSWEHHTFDGKDVAKEMFVVQHAVEQVMRQYAFLDDFASRFTSTTKQPGMVQLRQPRLSGLYADKDIAQQLTRALDTFDNVWRPNSPFVKYLREGTNIWKTLVTVVNPNHHIVNNMGDFFLSFMAGVNNPNVYRKAASLLKQYNTAFKDLDTVEGLVGRNALEQASSRAGKTVLKTHGGLKFTGEQLYIAAHQNGLLQSMHVIEDIMEAPISKQLSEMGGYWNPLKIGSKVSEQSGQFHRLAHFIDAVQKSKAKTIQEAVDQGIRESRRWHPDGQDLTKFEQKVKLVIPFYSWMRKSTPLILEGMLARPARATIPNKIAYNMQISKGEQSSMEDPFNTGGMWPGWMVEPHTKNPVLAPRNPMSDLFNQFGVNGPVGGMLGQLSPGIKVPTELMLDKRIDSGSPITDKNKYLIQQTPILSKGKSLSSSDNAMFNWLTGFNKTNPYDPNSSWNKYKTKQEEAKRKKAIRKWAKENGLLQSDKGKIPDWIEQMYGGR